IDILVNNAATFSRDVLIDTKHDTLNHVMNVNFIAPFMLVSAFAKNLIEQARPGSIVNVSSLSASVSRGEMAAYQCSKAALEMLSKSAAYELAGRHIRSNVIAPGLIETPANLNQRASQAEVWERRLSTIPLGRAGTPSDLTAAAVYLGSDEATWVTGCKIVVDGGASTF
ncbi:MAG: SDR family NAD(P)-dependent oxidoreductase, partial [Janthinobacterium lividum]